MPAFERNLPWFCLNSFFNCDSALHKYPHMHLEQCWLVQVYAFDRHFVFIFPNYYHYFACIGIMKGNCKQKCCSPSPTDYNPPLTGVRPGLHLARVLQPAVTIPMLVHLLLSRKTSPGNIFKSLIANGGVLLLLPYRLFCG